MMKLVLAPSRGETPHIPFNRPARVGRELDYIAQAIESNHASSGGPFSLRVAGLLAHELGAADVLLTTSCTDALELSALLLDVGPGDVVIVPSFTFVTTALAFARTGATIRFADIEPETLGIDPAAVECLLDDSVRAVVPVHYAGVGCEIVEIERVVAGRAAIVEDNAHGLFGRVGERLLGSFGRMSTLSFHETKNFTCGEGGALVLNDAADVERAHVLLDKGTNRRQFLNGAVDRYTWVDTGSSFGLSDLLAAYLWAQLEERTTLLDIRRRLFQRYDAILRPLQDEFGFRCPVVPPDRSPAWHMYYLILRSRAERDELLRHLAAEGVNATFHFVPLHSSPGGMAATDRVVQCPVSDDISGRLIRLPLYFDLSESDQEYVCSALLRFFQRGNA
ncbi:MAG: dTDP-4-amino-4,6-dideoxygalactose transaminase [Ilumatobacteraceae bacterium]